MNRSISMNEIDNAISRMKVSNKSADPDIVHPLMLKKLGFLFRAALLRLYELSFDTGKWVWEAGMVTFLRKPHKTDYTIANSFRPITLTSYVGKIFERVLKTRLRKYLEETNQIDEEQEGFRGHRSTVRYIYKLVDYIQTHTQTGKAVAALFIDLEKAFDPIWIDGLMFKLANAGVNGKMYDLLDNFVRTRQVRLKNGTNFSDAFKATVELPQGSILSPLLFIFYTADVFSKCKGKAFKYADDSTLVNVGVSVDNALNSLKADCDLITAWLLKWRLLA